MNLNVMAEYFKIDALSLFIALFAGIFAAFTIIYSLGSARAEKQPASYYLYIFLTFVSSLGAVFANNVIVFTVFWGFLGLLLYLLIGFGKKERAAVAAKKAFIIIGGTDAFIILGFALVWKMTGAVQMDKISVALTGKTAVCAYLCLAAGAFAKAGAMPFHTWVPDVAEDAPVPVTAYLPASLDKLLGIYFLARISLDLFVMNGAMNMFLMLVGSFTIIAAVMMALVQRDLKRLLGYHAVSQVGYMVLGIGTGNPVGVAGGLFHMLNNAIYKSCLFFSAGSVEKRAGTSDLEKLGAYSKAMPITFITFLTASLAISGVPPFNGFVSKWMVYQGIIETGKSGGGLWMVCLAAAMFGSALTLASFMKLIHAVFLGQPANASGNARKYQEVGPFMWMPPAVLAVLCVAFGIFAWKIPLEMFIFPCVPKVAFPGVWEASLAALLVLLGIATGIAIYFMGTVAKTRETRAFTGGERIEDYPCMRVSGTDFYDTIKEMGILKFLYKLSEKKLFDVYEMGARATFGINAALGRLHNGMLPAYLAWCLLGMAALFYFLLKG